MGILVMKFGASAVSDVERIRASTELAREAAGRGTREGTRPQDSVLAVVSAMPGVTDALFSAATAAQDADLSVAKRVCSELRGRHLAAARALAPEGCAETEIEIESILAALDSRLQGVRLVGELSDRSMDEIAATGERLSALLFALALGAPCLDARMLVRTDSRFGRARVDQAATARLVAERLLPLLGPGRIAVTQGCIGSDSLGSTTTFGRGGSDYSASLFGAALGASEIRIWTEAEGIPTCDPTVVPQARTVELLGFDEAAELVAYGAKSLHPAAIRPALEAGITVTVRSAAHPEGLFTTIKPRASSGKPVAAIAMRRNVAVVNVRQELMTDQAGFLARLFAAFGRLGVSVDLVATSEVCVSVSLDMEAPLEKIAFELAELGAVEVVKDRAVVAIVGGLLRETPALLRNAFDAIGDLAIDMVSMGANGINLSFVLAAESAETAVERLHAAFFGGAGGPDSGGAPT
ncbi:MAG: aspartate kinase [Spirochaetes bacterium]|nr:aspartate kinase [Spirochaetota bacterium]